MQKTEFISQYISFLTQTKAMISFSGAGIKDILTEVHSVPLLRKTISDTLRFMELGKPFHDSWNIAVDKSYKRKEFEDVDYSLIMSFAQGFGELGAEEETAKIDLCLSNAVMRYEKLQNETVVRQRLYRTIGMFCGVLTAILLI